MNTFLPNIRKSSDRVVSPENTTSNDDTNTNIDATALSVSPPRRLRVTIVSKAYPTKFVLQIKNRENFISVADAVRQIGDECPFLLGKEVKVFNASGEFEYLGSNSIDVFRDDEIILVKVLGDEPLPEVEDNIDRRSSKRKREDENGEEDGLNVQKKLEILTEQMLKLTKTLENAVRNDLAWKNAHDELTTKHTETLKKATRVLEKTVKNIDGTREKEGEQCARGNGDVKLREELREEFRTFFTSCNEQVKWLRREDLYARFRGKYGLTMIQSELKEGIESGLYEKIGPLVSTHPKHKRERERYAYRNYKQRDFKFLSPPNRAVLADLAGKVVSSYWECDNCWYDATVKKLNRETLDAEVYYFFDKSTEKINLLELAEKKELSWSLFADAHYPPSSVEAPTTPVDNSTDGEDNEGPDRKSSPCSPSRPTEMGNLD